MKSNHVKTIAGVVSLIVIVFLLAGCTAKPDDSGKNVSGVGNQNIVPFPVRSTEPPALVTPTIVPIVLPSSGLITGATINPWGSVTQIPGVFLTPTPIIGIISVTQIPTQVPLVTPVSTILKLGATGDAVRSLQSRLKALGYLTGSVDGDFGEATENALKAFQARNGLTADGIAGPATLNKLNSSSALPPRPTAKPTAKPTPKPTPRATPTPKISQNVFLQNGSSGDDVRRMQSRLIALGYLAGLPTGRFDDATEDAVYAFQRRNVSYADGIAGPMTLEKLYSSSARGTSGTEGIIGVTLTRGMMDSPAVRLLQSKLKELRFYDGAVDGDFGASTESAVKSFQASNGLVADGKAGEGTLRVIFGNGANSAGRTATPRPVSTPAVTPIAVYVNVTANPDGSYVSLREGNSGTLVRNLQQGLKNLNYFNLVVDGKFGIGTSEAVKKFQRDRGLSQDGVAGPATQRILFEGNFPEGS